MTKLIKVTAKELNALNFKGIEVLETVDGISSSDFRGLQIRDTVTGTIIDIRMSPYSDFAVHTQAPPVFEDTFTVKGKNTEGIVVTADFTDEAKAETFKGSLTEATVVKTQRQIE